MGRDSDVFVQSIGIVQYNGIHPPAQTTELSSIFNYSLYTVKPAHVVTEYPVVVWGGGR